MPDVNKISRAASCLPSSKPAPLTRLTGRDTEVALLKDRWEQAQEGMGQIVLIVGDPGLGKSRLVHTIKRIVLEQENAEASQSEPEAATKRSTSSVIEWRCSQRFQNTELFPVADHLGKALGFGSVDSATAQFDRLARHLDELGLDQPEVVALLAKLLFLPSDERYPAAGLTPVREREETFRALRQWLKAHSDRQPLIFVIEDLHWVDASTLEFLGQFIAEGFHDRILTVLTCRPEFKAPWPANAHQTSLALNRLTRRQVSDLLIRKDAGSLLPDSLVEQIYQRTGGVPLLVEEFAPIVRESVNARDVPETLQDLILGRLDRMSSNRRVAQVAAMLGREFHYEMLAAVVGTDRQTLLAELDKLVTAEILFVKGPPPDCTYIFKHLLLAEALDGALGDDERQRSHRQIAETMEARFPEVAERQPELLAHHFTEAGLIEKGVAYWLKSALRSRERFANVEAIAHLTKGLALLERLVQPPERDALELEFLGPLGTAYIASRGYAAPEVGPIFDRARELCERLEQTPQRFAMMWGNFAFHVVRGDFRLCADLAEEAMGYGERLNDPGILMEALFLRGLTKLYRGDFSGAEEACARSITDYDDRARTAYWATLIGEDAGVTNRCYLALALWHLGFPDRALELNRETIALAREINHPFSLEYALHHTGWLHQHCRLGVLTQTAGEEQMRIATEQGFPFWHASGTLYRAAGLVLQGNMEAGLEQLEKGLTAYRATGGELALPYYLSLLADTYITMRRFDDARRALDEALLFVEKNDDRFQEAELLRLSGELRLAESGDKVAAENCFNRAIQTARRQSSRAFELRATVSLEAVMHFWWCKVAAWNLLRAAPIRAM